MDPRVPGDMEIWSLWVMTHKTIDVTSSVWCITLELWYINVHAVPV